MRRTSRQPGATPDASLGANRSWRRWIRSERGTVLVEQALFLALIGGGVFFAADTVGLATQKTLAQLGTASQVSADAKNALIGQIESSLPSADLTTELASAERSVYFLRLTAVGGILVFGVGLWYLLYRKAQKEGKDSSPAAVVKPEAETDFFTANVFSKRQEMLRTLLADPSSVIENHLTVRQLMSTRLVKVTPTATKRNIEYSMARAGTRHLLVCDETDRLVGIISNRDMAREGKIASQIMTADPLTLEADSPLLPTVTTFLRHCISSLPVTDEGRLVGVLTTTDLIMAFQCTFQIIERTGIIIGSRPTPEKEGRIAEDSASVPVFADADTQL